MIIIVIRAIKTMVLIIKIKLIFLLTKFLTKNILTVFINISFIQQSLKLIML